MATGEQGDMDPAAGQQGQPNTFQAGKRSTQAARSLITRNRSIILRSKPTGRHAKSLVMHPSGR